MSSATLCHPAPQVMEDTTQLDGEEPSHSHDEVQEEQSSATSPEEIAAWLLSLADTEVVRTLVDDLSRVSSERSSALWALARGFNDVSHKRQCALVSATIRGFAALSPEEQAKAVTVLAPQLRVARRGWREAPRPSAADDDSWLPPLVGAAGRHEADAHVVELLDSIEASLRQLPSEHRARLYRRMDKAVTEITTPSFLGELVSHLPPEEDEALEEWLIDEDALPEHVATRFFTALRHVNLAARTAKCMAVGAEELFGDLAQNSADSFWQLWLQGRGRAGLDDDAKTTSRGGRSSVKTSRSKRKGRRATSPASSVTSCTSCTTTDSSGYGINIGTYEGPLRRGPLVVGMLTGGYQPTDCVPVASWPSAAAAAEGEPGRRRMSNASAVSEGGRLFHPNAPGAADSNSPTTGAQEDVETASSVSSSAPRRKSAMRGCQLHCPPELFIWASAKRSSERSRVTVPAPSKELCGRALYPVHENGEEDANADTDCQRQLRKAERARRREQRRSLRAASAAAVADEQPADVQGADAEGAADLAPSSSKKGALDSADSAIATATAATEAERHSHLEEDEEHLQLEPEQGTASAVAPEDIASERSTSEQRADEQAASEQGSPEQWEDHQLQQEDEEEEAKQKEARKAKRKEKQKEKQEEKLKEKQRERRKEKQVEKQMAKDVADTSLSGSSLSAVVDAAAAHGRSLGSLFF